MPPWTYTGHAATDIADPISEEKTESEHSEGIEKIGGDDGARTRDLRRDRPAF